jgi:hypothetical protein
VENNIRRQLTLFIEPNDAYPIERIRQQFNPRQSELIKCHVTLCREEEIDKLEQVITNLSRLTRTEIVIEFGEAVRFDNGKGLLLPGKGDNTGFQDLRRQILCGIITNPRILEPHITLMHPRNSTCTDNIYSLIEKVKLPSKFEFKKVSLIEQQEGEKWRTIQGFKLTNRT